MEKNLILEGLLSMVTELKEKQEAQVTPASCLLYTSDAADEL